tara:strand:- start:939 stop:1331 length:393 start_codon:yes stop_codon:yes gene_type:complete
MKKCSRCKIEKEKDFFTKRKSSKDGVNGRCKNCCSLVFNKWAKKNKEKQKKRCKDWHVNNKEHSRNYAKEYNKKRSYNSIITNRKKQVNNLSDSYVKACLKNEKKHITPEIIKIKRIIIKINRLTKQKQI